MTNSIRKGWFGRTFLLAVAACAAVLGAKAAPDALPSGYVEAEYFDSGNGSILLDLVPNRTDRLEADFEFNALPARTVVGVFCSRDASNTASTRMIVSTTASEVPLLNNTYGNTQLQGVTGMAVHNRMKLVYDGSAKEVYLNGETEAMFNTSETFTPKAKLRIFAIGNESQSANESDMRLYSFKVFAADGSRRLDLVPCMEWPTGGTPRPGLYDLIGEKFYAGGSNAKAKLLVVPPEYEELDYVQSQGNEFTTFTSNFYMEDTIRATVSFVDVRSGVTEGIFSSRDNNNTESTRYMCFLQGKTLKMAYGVNAVYSWGTEVQSGDKHEVEMNGSTGTFSIDRQVCKTFPTTYTGLAGSYGWIFGLRTGGSLGSAAKMKLYSFEWIKASGECQDKLIPARKKDTQEIGLYGLMTRTFYKNKGSTGSAFLAGSTVCNRWLEEPSLERTTWTTEERPPKVNLGRPRCGIVSCDKTEADLLALEPGDHEVVFTVAADEGYAALEKRIAVTVSAPTVPTVEPGELTVEMIKEERVATGARLQFPAANVDRECYVVWGRRDRGVDLGGWTNRQVVATVPAGATAAEITLPEPLSEGGFRVALAVPATAKSYVQGGLVAQYDGIENGGLGRHLERYSSWRNLRSRLTTSDIPTLYNDGFEDTAFVLGRTERRTEATDVLSVAQSGSTMTLELNAIPDRYSSLNTAALFLNVPARGGFGWAVDRQGPIATRRFASNMWYYRSYTIGTTNTLSALVAGGNPYHTYTARLAPDSNSVNLDGAAMSLSGWNFSADSTSTDCGIKLGITSVGAKIRSLRIYDRNLSPEEETHNRAVDAVRFEGAAPLASDCVVSAYQRPVMRGLVIVIQ